MLDEVAAAANWARRNAKILIDTHWVGGNPEQEEVYGWASWQPGRGILALRNPSDDVQSLRTTLKTALELPGGVDVVMTARSVYVEDIVLPADPIPVDKQIEFTLQPWEAVVMEWES